MAEEKEKKMQEMYMEFQMIEQNIKQLQKQLEMLTNQMMEVNSTINGLDEFNKIKGEKQVFVPLSSGIFAKAAIKDTSELLVNVGANVVITKDLASTKKLMQKQFEEMRKVQSRLVGDLEKMAERAGQLEMQLQGMVPQG